MTYLRIAAGIAKLRSTVDGAAADAAHPAGGSGTAQQSRSRRTDHLERGECGYNRLFVRLENHKPPELEVADWIRLYELDGSYVRDFPVPALLVSDNNFAATQFTQLLLFAVSKT